MSRKTVVIIVGSLVVAAFLLGFIPEYLKSRSLGSQLSSARQEVATQQAKLQGDELDLLIGYVYLQTSQKNYGLASDYSTRFFNRVRSMASQASDPNRQKFFQSALSKRDAVTSGLAKGDPATLGDVQALFQSALESTQTDWK